MTGFGGLHCRCKLLQRDAEKGSTALSVSSVLGSHKCVQCKAVCVTKRRSEGKQNVM